MSRGFKISVVLVVVAFLCGIFIMPRLSSSRKAHARYVVDAIEAGLSSFLNNHERYPTTAEGLTALIERPPTIPAANWHGPYTYLQSDELLKDPWGHKFVYRFPGLHNPGSFDVFSCGPDGTPDTADDIGNWSSAETTVVVYTSQDEVYAEPILKDFQKQTGIEVKTVFDSEAVKTVGLVNRLLAEKSNPQCDVFWNNEEFRTRQLASKGVFRDTNAWTHLGYRTRRMVINTKFIKAAAAPRAWSDVTNKIWFHKVALAYPLFGTTSTHFQALRQLWGDAAWQSWCRALAANNPFVVDGNSVVVKQVARGEGLDRPGRFRRHCRRAAGGRAHSGPARHPGNALSSQHRSRDKELSPSRSRAKALRFSARQEDLAAPGGRARPGRRHAGAGHGQRRPECQLGPIAARPRARHRRTRKNFPALKISPDIS